MMPLPLDGRKGDPSASHETKAACMKRDMHRKVQSVFFFMVFIVILST